MLSADDRKAILELYDGLRVADVRDGLDWNMLHDQGSLDPGIRPLWRTHIVGFARTMRYVPTDKKIPDMSPDEYTTYAYDYWYGEVTNIKDPWEIEDGDDLYFLNHSDRILLIDANARLIMDYMGRVPPSKIIIEDLHRL
jgi:hypothetical protein